MRDRDPSRRSAGSADDDVAPGVDRERPLPGERRRGPVGREPLGRAAEVEPDAGRAPDLAARHRDGSPQGRLRGRGGTPRRSGAEGGAQRRRLCVPARLGVAGRLERADQGRVDQAAASLRRVDRSQDGAGHQPRGGPRRRGVGVQPAQLAVGSEAAQLEVARAQQRLGRGNRQVWRGRALGRHAAGENPDRRSEQLERALVLAGHELVPADHEALVTTPEGEPPDWSCENWSPEAPEPWSVLFVEEPAVAAVLVPAPSAGSCPCAIWTARPPKIAPAAASDAAIMRILSVRVAGFMRRTLAAVPQPRLRAALALYKNQSPIRNRSARAEPPCASISTRSGAPGSKASSSE